MVCLSLIGIVLIQHGKGADIGAAFGSGASNTIFGSQGSGDFLSRATAWLAVTFFVLCLVMTTLVTRQAQDTFIDLEKPFSASQSSDAARDGAVPLIPD